MNGGELFDRVVAKEKYTEREAAGVIRDISRALAYCHEHRIAHRDLKVPRPARVPPPCVLTGAFPRQPENLLYETEAEDSCIKIADFGLAKLLSEDAMMMQTACGTPGYVGAPPRAGDRPVPEAPGLTHRPRTHTRQQRPRFCAACPMAPPATCGVLG